MINFYSDDKWDWFFKEGTPYSIVSRKNKNGEYGQYWAVDVFKNLKDFDSVRQKLETL